MAPFEIHLVADDKSASYSPDQSPVAVAAPFPENPAAAAAAAAAVEGGEEEGRRRRRRRRGEDGADGGDEEVEEAAATEEDEPPNGGYGWVCVACCFVINMHTWGLNSSYGVFLDHYLRGNVFPEATVLEFAYVGGLSISTALLISPLATTTTRLYGTRATLMIGVALEAVSFVAASFATRIWHLFLSQGACFGVGMGFLFVGSVTVAPAWFTTRRSLAMGIASAGSGIGGLAYSLAAAALIERLSLAWAFRVLGAAALAANFASSALVRDRNRQVGSTLAAFDWRLFRRAEFLLFQAFGVLSMFAYVALLFSLPNFATRSLGLTPAQGSVVGAVLNLGQAFGRPPIGYFSDAFGRINMAGVMTALAGLLCLVLWVVADSYGVLLFFALAVGMVAGTYWTVVAPVGAEVVGLRELASALSITWVVLVPPCTFSETIGLAIVENSGGSYLGAQLFAGFMYIGAAGAMLLLRAWKIGQLEGEEALRRERGGEEKGTAGEKRRVGGPQTSFAARLVRWQKV